MELENVTLTRWNQGSAYVFDLPDGTRTRIK